jgi:hypothetical protein
LRMILQLGYRHLRQGDGSEQLPALRMGGNLFLQDLFNLNRQCRIVT